MDDQEFWEWLNTCPSDKWEVLTHENYSVSISFHTNIPEEDESIDKTITIELLAE